MSLRIGMNGVRLQMEPPGYIGQGERNDVIILWQVFPSYEV
jgi:hypothetical protein